MKFYPFTFWLILVNEDLFVDMLNIIFTKVLKMSESLPDLITSSLKWITVFWALIICPKR